MRKKVISAILVVFMIVCQLWGLKITTSAAADDVVSIGDVTVENYAESVRFLHNVAEVTQSSTGQINIKLTKNIRGRIRFCIDYADIVFDANGKTLYGSGTNEPICIENYCKTKFRLCGNGILVNGVNNAIFSGSGNYLAIESGAFIGRLYVYDGDFVADDGDTFSIYKIKSATGNQYTLGEAEVENKTGKCSIDDYYGNICVIQSNHTHVLTKIDKTESTCSVNGNIEYYKCNICARFFADENATNELSQEKVELPLEAHDYEEAYSSDDTSHWHKCKNCDAIDAKEAHTGGEATYSKKAVCDICGAEYGSVLTDNEAPTITGIKDDGEYCLSVVFTVKDDDLESVTDYIGGETKTLKSSTGMYTVGSGVHTITAKDSAGNKTVVRIKVNATHTRGPAATEDEPQLCLICNALLQQAYGHKHRLHLTKVENAESTCTTKGNIEYYVCECGKLFSDANAVTEITKEDTESELKAHVESDWITDTEAGYDKAGAKHKECTVCGQVLSNEEIPAVQSPDKPEAPQTGDNNNMVLYVSMLLLSVAGLLVVISKKRTGRLIK